MVAEGQRLPNKRTLQASEFLSFNTLVCRTSAEFWWKPAPRGGCCVEGELWRREFGFYWRKHFWCFVLCIFSVAYRMSFWVWCWGTVVPFAALSRDREFVCRYWPPQSERQTCISVTRDWWMDHGVDLVKFFKGRSGKMFKKIDCEMLIERWKSRDFLFLNISCVNRHSKRCLNVRYLCFLHRLYSAIQLPQHWGPSWRPSKPLQEIGDNKGRWL